MTSDAADRGAGYGIIITIYLRKLLPRQRIFETACAKIADRPTLEHILLPTDLIDRHGPALQVAITNAASNEGQVVFARFFSRREVLVAEHSLRELRHSVDAQRANKLSIGKLRPADIGSDDVLLQVASAITILLTRQQGCLRVGERGPCDGRVYAAAVSES